MKVGGAKTETKKGREVRRWSKKKEKGWNRKRVLNREGWTDNFSAFIFLRIFSEKNYGELVCVGFNF